MTCPPLPPCMKSRPSTTIQRPRCWNTSEPDGFPRFPHLQYCHFRLGRSRRCLSSLSRPPAAWHSSANCENHTPHYSQNPSSRVQPSYGQRPAHTSKAERLSGLRSPLIRSELASFRRGLSLATVTGAITLFHMQSLLHYQLTSGRKQGNPHRQSPKLLPESPAIRHIDY